MAKVFGESGRYVSDQAVKQFHSMLVTAFTTVSVLSVMGGFLIGWSVGRNNWLWTAAIEGVLVMAMFGIWRWANPKLDELEKKRVAMRRGASGESSVALLLANFPDEFCVINDLTTPFGNLDHVVVGPTGVFVLDTKNWRGVVSADGKGELLLNGRPTDKPQIRQFVGRVMGMKDKIKVMAPEFDPYFQTVFVFTAARVDANWGLTGNVNCIRDDQLFTYIVEKEFGRKLKRNEADRIAQAFLGLAHMDKDFTSRSYVPAKSPKSRSQPPMSVEQSC